MSRRAVKTGQHVRQGQLIGYVGMTGLATGPHVCYRFWKNGRQVDPLREKFPSAEPIVNSEKPAFDSLMVLEKSRLDKIVLKELASAK
jgi:murein DD-endopeptidase MepM/ murein hydrolase activator NlpD